MAWFIPPTHKKTISLLPLIGPLPPSPSQLLQPVQDPTSPTKVTVGKSGVTPSRRTNPLIPDYHLPTAHPDRIGVYPCGPSRQASQQQQQQAEHDEQGGAAARERQAPPEVPGSRTGPYTRTRKVRDEGQQLHAK